MTLHLETGPRVAAPTVTAASTTAEVPTEATDWRQWRRGYVRALVSLDITAMAIGTLVALETRFGTTHVTSAGLSYELVVLALVVGWVGMLALSGTYNTKRLGIGSDEFKGIGNATVRVTAVFATVAYAARLELARGFLAVAIPVAVLTTLLFRYVSRQVLQHMRANGAAGHRVLVIGSGEPALELIKSLRQTPEAGLNVLGVCVPGGRREDSLGDSGVPVFGSLSNFSEALQRARADTVAVAHSPGITPSVLRALAWELEGTGVDLVVAPALTNVAGPRISVRPVSGLPLLHVDEPELSGPARIVKGVVDRLGAVLLIAVASPLLLLTALAVRLTSRGPVLFKQTRVGADGNEFVVLKFRSMLWGADRQHAALAEDFDRNGHVLFKMKDDPRVTFVGHWLRKHSLDELPQLFNVLLGDMSLVGPRPPLPSEVERYEYATHRRLLVKPGLTGLWQVSGRADLPWDESVRLDLYYVENWSLAMDFMILWKTVGAVVRGTGAY